MYLVETYLSREQAATLPQLEERAALAARLAGRTGEAIRLARSLFTPEDETWFCVYEAADRAGVERASALAGIAFERVVEVVSATDRPMQGADR